MRIFTPIVFALLAHATCWQMSAQNFVQLTDGVEYAESSRDVSGQQIKMNLLRLDLTKVRLDVVHALDTAIGTETTSSIAKRRGAFAAINAGFFRLDNTTFAGDAAGVLKIDGKILSEGYQNRISLLIRNETDRTSVSISHINVDGFLTFGRDVFYEIGINRQRKENDILILTPEFGATTLTDARGTDIVVENGKVKRIEDGKGNISIPRNGFVISISGAKRSRMMSQAKVGLPVSVQFLSIGGPAGWKDPSETPAPFAESEDIVGGVPQLVRTGKVSIPWEQEKTVRSFVETRHPRTAVAQLKDGRFLMVTVDGRSESSGGIGLFDLASLLIELGAVDAMNLDGGGSTTMFVDGKVVNHPSDKEGERRVSDALLVTPRKAKSNP